MVFQVGQPGWRKGLLKLGGRKKGTPNKKTQLKLQAQLAREREIQQAKVDFQAAMAGEMKFTPLQVMQAVILLRIGRGDDVGALEAARDAAPYVHARLNATDVRVQHSLANRSDAELAADIERIRQKLVLVQQPAAPLIDLTSQRVQTADETGDETMREPNDGEIPPF